MNNKNNQNGTLLNIKDITIHPNISRLQNTLKKNIDEMHGINVNLFCSNTGGTMTLGNYLLIRNGLL